MSDSSATISGLCGALLYMRRAYLRHLKLDAKLYKAPEFRKPYLKSHSSSKTAYNSLTLNSCMVSFYRAMHFSAYARSWDRMSSVCPSVLLSVTLVDCDHIGWKSWKLIARTISPTPSLFVAKRRSTYFQGNMGKF